MGPSAPGPLRHGATDASATRLVRDVAVGPSSSAPAARRTRSPMAWRTALDAQDRHRPRRRPRRPGRPRGARGRGGDAGRAEGRDHRRAGRLDDRPTTSRTRTRPTTRRASTPRTSSGSTPRTRPGPRRRPLSRAPRWSSTWVTATASRARTGRAPGRTRRTGWGSTRRRVSTTARPSTGASTTSPATCDLAPNAVVLLHHLCYASGNSESGKPAPSPSTARQRVDNMAAGWLRAGARAVVAEGHFGPAWYVQQLFTTHKTIDRIWHDSPTFNDRAFTFASSRTTGATAEMDPDGTSNGYWRALTGWLGTTTDQMTGAAYAATDGDPAAVVVPGNATVRAAADGSGVGGVYPDDTLTPDSGTMLPPSTVAGGTKLRVLAKGADPTFDGSTAYQVGTFPDGDPLGWMSAADLVPRDSASPVVWSVDDGDGAFSPNGDGSGDLYRLTARLSESADWRVEFQDPDGTTLASKTGTRVLGRSVVDRAGRRMRPCPTGPTAGGSRPSTAGGNPAGSKSGTFRVDTVAPAFDDLAAAADPRPGAHLQPERRRRRRHDRLGLLDQRGGLRRRRRPRRRRASGPGVHERDPEGRRPGDLGRQDGRRRLPRQRRLHGPPRRRATTPGTSGRPGPRASRSTGASGASPSRRPSSTRRISTATPGRPGSASPSSMGRRSARRSATRPGPWS